MNPLLHTDIHIVGYRRRLEHRVKNQIGACLARIVNTAKPGRPPPLKARSSVKAPYLVTLIVTPLWARVSAHGH